MSDYASQDDFDNLKDTVNGVVSQAITLTDGQKATDDTVNEVAASVKELQDTVKELQGTVTDLQATVEKMKADLYDQPKYIRLDGALAETDSMTTGILTKDTLLTCPTLQAAVMLFAPPKS
jgi:uncharacterized protein YoxC